MCGIIGYIGDRDVCSILLVGLERLSYRGYDSSGIAVMDQNELSYWRKMGKVHELSRVLESLTIKAQMGIGHTRWSTHGLPSDFNAHPQLDTKEQIAIVHNGIVENNFALRKELEAQGCLFRSETDSEVIVQFIGIYAERYSMLDAVRHTIAKLEGSYAIALISERSPGEIYLCKNGAPLIIGKGMHEWYFSSDAYALLPHTQELIYLEDNDICILKKDAITIYNQCDIVDRPSKMISKNITHADKGHYPCFMIKEIFEQSDVANHILDTYICNDTIHFDRIATIDFDSLSRFIIQACGTSWHAGLYGRYVIEKFSQTLTEVDISSEFRYREIISHGKELFIAISQSGETADTLACIRQAKSGCYPVLSFINVEGSSIDRESDAVIYTYSGHEIGVASTKNYTAQLIAIYLFSIYMGLRKKVLSLDQSVMLVQALKKIPTHISATLRCEPVVKKIAEELYAHRSFLFIGRGVNYPSALEGALKLKEISYIHATGYAAGELKHGPLALIDETVPVICICPKTSTYNKMIGNVQEVKSRGGKTVVIATEGDEDLKKLADYIIYIPETTEELTPILVSIPLQILAYCIALKLGCNVDQPRHLAKSVTVE